MKSIRIEAHPEAEEELKQAADWYGQQRPRLDQEFVEAIDRAWVALREGYAALSPVLYVPAELGVQRVLVARFPYQVFVRRRPDESVQVLAVAHHRRRPGYWLPRLVK